MGMYGKLSDILFKFIIYLGCASFVTTLFLMVLDRYLFHVGFFWSMEVSKLLYVWVCFIACALGFKQGRLISAPIVIDRLPASIAKRILLVNDFLALSFILVVAVVGFRLILRMYGFGQVTVYLSLPYCFLYAAIPVAFGFMGIDGSIALIRKLRGK